MFGAAELAAIDKKSMPIAPVCFVIPLNEKALQSAVQGRHPTTVVQYSIGILSVVRNVKDATGEAAHISLEPVRDELWRGLVGWKDETMHYPVEWLQGRIAGFDNMLLRYLDVFVGQETRTGTSGLNCK